MNQTDLIPERPHGGIDLLACAFATTVAMWIVGYLTHMPLIQAPGWVVFMLLIVTLAGGGFLLGRFGRRNLGGPVVTALIIATLNLLVLGAVLTEVQHGPSPLVWLPGYCLATVVIVVVGWGAGLRCYVERDFNWQLLFGGAAVAAVALVVSAGGLVTGFDAGFSVPDWPNTYGANMFLFPLSRMTGGIYYEHTHRMAGALVGLTALTLMIWLWTTDRSRGIKLFATAAFLLVCVQGVIGGLWVIRVDPADAEAMAHAVQLPDGSFVAEPSIAYVIFHGTTGQLILGLFVVLAAMFSKTWRQRDIAVTHESVGIDRTLAVMLVVALTIQLMLGVYIRKEAAGTAVLMHISFAVIVAVLAIGAGIRASSLWGERFAVLKYLGTAVCAVVLLQLCLGLLALLFRDAPTGRAVTVGSDQVGSTTDAVVTTLHQSTGAALLALAALLLAWNYRLLKVPAMPAKQPPPEDVPVNHENTKARKHKEAMA